MQPASGRHTASTRSSARSFQSVVDDRNSQYLVVVYPSTPQAWTPLGTYYENLIIHSPLKLQGVGSGGVYPDGTTVQGSIVNGSFFTNTTPGDQQFLNGTPETGVGLDNTEPVLLHWEQIMEATSGIVETPPANRLPSVVTMSSAGFHHGVPGERPAHASITQRA